jgi:hypothetical protein
LNLRGQVGQPHDLRHAGGGDLSVVSKFGLVLDHAVRDQLVTLDSECHEAGISTRAEYRNPLPTNISPQVDTTQPVGLTVQLRVAKKTRQRFVSRVTRLYEQGSIIEVIEGYVRRWKQWATGGLGEFVKQLTLDDDACGYLQSLRCRVSPSR